MPQTATTSARALALHVIDHTLRGQDLQAALNHHLSQSPLSPQDRHLATQLSYGFFRTQYRLEFMVQSMLTKGKSSLPEFVLRPLCLGVFELCFLSRIPDYASVHWYVQWIKKRASKPLSGVANAILRRIGREKEQVMDQSFYTRDNPELPTFLSRYYACPEWIVRLCLATYPPHETESFLQAGMAPPPIGLRLNPKTLDRDDAWARLKQAPTLLQATDSGLAMSSPPQDVVQPAEQAGLLTRQSLAAQIVLERSQPRTWAGPIWDACAGRGLKTTHLLELGCHPVWASDQQADKLLGCRQELTRLHLPRIPLFAADARTPPFFSNRPRSILLDVPCSGLGVLSRRPDIKAKRTPQDVHNIHSLQSAMLTSALACLPPGGQVMYITCTITPEENQNLVHEAVTKHGRAQILHTWPPDLTDQLGEFFYAALIKNRDKG